MSKNLRQAIVIITDGADQRSRLKLEQFIRLVQSSRAQLFIIGFYDEPAYVNYTHSDKTVTLVTGQQADNPLIVFDRLAKESGAEAFFPNTEKGPELAVGKILNTLHTQYTLAYYAEGSTKNVRRVQVRLNRGGFKIRARESVTRPDPADEEIQFDPNNCEVSAKAHPYPYEARVTESGGTLEYREDFSDPQTGWPNHPGSRYVANGYELSYSQYFLNGIPRSADLSKEQEVTINGPVKVGSLAAYGPWWSEFRASVYVDAAWAKMRPPTPMHSPKSMESLDASSAGIVFRLRDAGYYAFLLSTSPRAYEEDRLSYKLVKRTYGDKPEQFIVRWTRLSAKQAQQEITTGIKLTVECRGDEINLFVDDQQVGHFRDATYDSGYIGFISLGVGRAVFRNLRVEGMR